MRTLYKFLTLFSIGLCYSASLSKEVIKNNKELDKAISKLSADTTKLEKFETQIPKNNLQLRALPQNLPYNTAAAANKPLDTQLDYSNGGNSNFMNPGNSIGLGYANSYRLPVPVVAASPLKFYRRDAPYLHKLQNSAVRNVIASKIARLAKNRGGGDENQLDILPNTSSLLANRFLYKRAYMSPYEGNFWGQFE